MSLRIEKIRSAALIPGSRWEKVHALWQVKGVEGLTLTGHVGLISSRPAGWRVGGTKEYYDALRARRSTDGQLPEHFHQAHTIIQRLQGQIFPTRSDTLQAIEMTLLIIDTEEGTGINK